ncbi:MAG: hypothetical protein ACM31C_23735 [Acidobacteriota bacterium]
MHRWLVACVIAAGCGSDSSGGGPIPIESLQASYNAYDCNELVRCGLVSDVLTCGRLRLDVGSGVTPDLVAAVQAGTVIYDAAAAETCLAAITASCDRSVAFTNTSRSAPAACDQMFTGTVAAGGVCAFDDECVSRYCSMASCSTTGQPLGTCVGSTAPTPRPALGEACTSNPSCIASYCDPTTVLCVALLPAGASCSSNDACQLGLACKNATCTPLAPTGGACVSDNDCRDVGDYCSATQTCTAFGVAGATCASDSDCSIYYRCDATSGTCVLRPELGQPCGPQPLDCIDRSYCDGTTGTCTALEADGLMCASSTQCQSNYCDFTTGVAQCGERPICY